MRGNVQRWRARGSSRGWSTLQEYGEVALKLVSLEKLNWENFLTLACFHKGYLIPKIPTGGFSFEVKKDTIIKFYIMITKRKLRGCSLHILPYFSTRQNRNVSIMETRAIECKERLEFWAGKKGNTFIFSKFVLDVSWHSKKQKKKNRMCIVLWLWKETRETCRGACTSHPRIIKLFLFL